MFEGGNKNLAAYMQSERFRSRQTFNYEFEHKHWVSGATKNIIGFKFDDWFADDTVGTFEETEENENKNGMRWDIYYCKD